ncbi:MAG TPA: RluA family pseudouridine synthase [Saprospiraceae bacterium]|nr:RluA family pseudouridine synthase [Saprospiraceae bacterium]HMP23199.1 RluA family pseudouridine synthase [Saprospiraceae bacterium]
MQIPVLYESNWLLAVHKPTGLTVEQSPHHASVEDWVRSYLGQQAREPFVGIIHRLDRAVSGVLLLAKRKAALKDLNAQFRERRVQKTYLALVVNPPQQPEDTLIHWLQKDVAGKRAIIHETPAPQATECRLSYRLLHENAQGYVLEVHLHTGKFHQIRAQLAHIGCPIVGDSWYDGSATPIPPDAIALHAWQLHFTDPFQQQEQIVIAPPPIVFA